MSTLLVSKPDVSLLYMCRRSELRLVKTPKYPIYGIGGQTIGEKAGQTIAFHDGVFRCPPTGEVMLEDGRKADAAEVTEWLDGHRLNGQVEEGFWRVDPTAPPVSRDEMQLIVDAGIDEDVEKLREIIEQEEGGWNRNDLLKSARHVIDKLAAKTEGAEKPAGTKPERA